MSPADTEYQRYAYQNFIRLLLEAESSFTEADHFDVRSEDPESVKRWEELKARSFVACFELIDFCGISSQPIIIGMEKLHGITMADLKND